MWAKFLWYVSWWPELGVEVDAGCLLNWFSLSLVGMSRCLGVIILLSCSRIVGRASGLPCFAVGSLIVVWLVPGMWAIVFNMCCFIRLLFVSG